MMRVKYFETLYGNLFYNSLEGCSHFMGNYDRVGQKGTYSPSIISKFEVFCEYDTYLNFSPLM